MSLRAKQIASAFEQSHEFYYRGHSALDLLAMAYDELAEAKDKADERAAEAERALDSMCEQRAIDLTQHTEIQLTACDRMGVWQLVLRPILHTINMLSAHPSKWEPRAREAVTENVARNLSYKIMEVALAAPVESR